MFQAAAFGAAFGVTVAGYDDADTLGAEIGDITLELLTDVLSLVHPDEHPPERHELAERVTTELLALKPYVFPKPKPKPKPKSEPEPEPEPNFTDIRLPESDLGGLELAQEAREGNPTLKVLYTSGDALTDGMKAMFVDGGRLSKPYTADCLTTALDEVLSDDH